MLILQMEKVRPEETLTIDFGPGLLPPHVISRSGLPWTSSVFFLHSSAKLLALPWHLAAPEPPTAVTVLKGPLGHSMKVALRDGEATIPPLRRKSDTAH